MNKLYALVQDNTIQRINIQLPISLEGIYIPQGAEGLEQYNLYEIQGQEPLYNSSTQRLAGPSYVFDGTAVQRIYTVEDIPQEELMKSLSDSIVQQVQLRLDNFAKTKNYDGILSACTYATSVNPAFKAEGQYCVELRDNTWAVLYQILEEVQSGIRDIPSSYQDIESELPALGWPI